MTAALVFDIETLPLAREEIIRRAFGGKDVSAEKADEVVRHASLRAEFSKLAMISVAVFKKGDPEPRSWEQSAHWEQRLLEVGLDGGANWVPSVLRSQSVDAAYGIPGETQEADVLREFWRLAAQNPQCPAVLYGWNSGHFDLPYLKRRSFLLGVPVPKRLGLSVDLMDIWRAGDPEPCRIGLGALARSLGIGDKTGGATGHDFARMNQGERRDYAAQDLALTCAIRDRFVALGFCG